MLCIYTVLCLLHLLYGYGRLYDKFVDRRRAFEVVGETRIDMKAVIAIVVVLGGVCWATFEPEWLEWKKVS